MNGLLVLDKPQGVTSRDAVNRVQRQLPRKTKLGHTGTLDPLATGVLVLCVGNATRLAEYVQGLPKTYETLLRLGARSDTDDADGTVTPVPDAVAPGEQSVRAALAVFLGEIEQVPPAYSAAKLAGRRAYDRARRGEEVSLAPRTVRVDGIEVLDFAHPELRLRIDCGKGTYIRSIARDLGDRLGCGAYVAELRRTRVGPFTPERSVRPDATPDELRQRLLPVAAAVAHLPAVTLDEEPAAQLRQGRIVFATSGAPDLPAGAEAAAFGPGGELIGVVRREDPGRLAPVKVLAG